MARPGTPATIFENPYFKLLLGVNALICAVSLGVMIWASTFENKDGDMPKAKDRIFAICQYAFTATVGTFGGLLCGRAAAPDKSPPAA